ncbi:hypothetical protein, partial [Paenibacillus lupini]
MKKKFRALTTLAVTALLVPTLIVNASSAAAASKVPTETAKVSSFFSQSSFEPFANTLIQKVLQNLAQEVQKAISNIQNGNSGNSGNHGNNGNNGNSGN